MTKFRWFQAQPRRLIALEALGMILMVGYVDFATGWEWSFFVFYAVPIMIVVWFLGRIAGIGTALCCGVAWFLANLEGNHYATALGYGVATVSRMAYFVFVAVGGAAIKARQDEASARILALERMRELEGDIVRVSEHEQQRIGRDLHDGLCQVLASIGCAATALKEDLQADAQTLAAEAAGEIEMLLEDAVEQARDLARGIFPVQMEQTGLPVALEELVQYISRHQHVEARLEAPGNVSVRDPEVAMHLYRIAQEACSNAVKHGKARHIVICLAQENGVLTMTITDDGSGLRPPVAGATGMGLKTMEYRARQIGAQFSLANRPAGGAIVCCMMNVTSASK